MLIYAIIFCSLLSPVTVCSYTMGPFYSKASCESMLHDTLHFTGPEYSCKSRHVDVWQ